MLLINQVPRRRPARRARRYLYPLLLLVLCTAARAQFTPVDVEQAPNLGVLVAQLGAQAAQPSTHLALELPDVTVPGKVHASSYSELPGTTTLVLVRGAFTAKPVAAGAAVQPVPPPMLARRVVGEVPPPVPPPVWIASTSVKAGDAARLSATFDVANTGVFTLFAHAQGRWWFVSREIKVGEPAPAATATSPATDAARPRPANMTPR